MTRPTVVIIEMDEERDRKACLALDLKVAGANRELAQWLLDHPQYTGAHVARGVGSGETKIKRLRHWAQSGFSDEKHPTQVRRGYANPARGRGADRRRTGPGGRGYEDHRDRRREAAAAHGPRRRVRPARPSPRWWSRSSGASPPPPRCQRRVAERPTPS